jgi:predicted O-methyltransferase YrrM
MEMTPERWEATAAYCREVFGQEDVWLAGLMKRATAAGLPPIAVSSDVGRLLLILVRMAGGEGGARRALELGTLAGYSGIWIARGLAAGGRLITVEPEERHAAFAHQAFEEAGVADRVEIRRKPALEVLPALAREFGPESFDFMFFDAIKTEYTRYFALADPLLKPRGLLVADNMLGSGDWWIDTPAGRSEARDAIDRFNRMMAAHPGYDVVVVPMREGVMVGRKRTESGSSR